MKYGKYMSDKIKLYLDLLLDSLFVNKYSLSNKIMKELHELMEDENQRIYIQYSFLAKKAYMKFEQKGPLKRVVRQQLENFAFLFRRIFEKEKNRSKINDFMMYSLLRFSSFIETKDKESLIQRFREFPLIDRPKFWKAILNYMSKYIYKHLNDKKLNISEKKEQSNNSFIKSFKGFFKLNQSNLKENIIKPSQVKSFEEISSLLFRIGCEFDTVVDILLVLGKDCNIPGTMIKQILNRNKEVLHQQLTDLNRVKLTKRDLESLRSVRSYDSVIRRAKGLTPRRSINLKSVEDPQLKSLAKEFEKKTEEKYSKILSVIKLSLQFLVVKYDSEGVLMRKEASLKSLEGSNLSQHDSVLEDSEEPTKKEDLKGNKVRNLLESVRSYEIKGIDDFLESATKLSQASKPQSPKKKKPKTSTKKTFSLEFEKSKNRKRDWKEKYRDCDDSVIIDLKDILHCLMLNTSIYKKKTEIIRKILLKVWPLSTEQRKYLYIEMTSESLSRDALLDYEESSYAFTRIRKVEKKEIKRQFGESFMKVRKKTGGLIDTIKNDFTPPDSKDDQSSEIIPDKSDAPITNLKNKTGNLIIKNKIKNPFIENSKVLENDQFPTETSSTPKMPKIYKNKNQNFQTEGPKGIRKIMSRHRSKSSSNSLPTKSKKQKPKPADNIITLDVKRTHVERKEFDHVSLEQVLRNISHPKMGNFAYYQGLNYIVAYVLDVMQDPVETYNVSIMLMEMHFRKYVNHNMDNLNILFYTLRRLIQVFLPNLASHIDRNENMEANATYANWFLTLFTTLKQFKENVRLLDQVFDIFMAKGWVGFFKCVLVIFYYLEEDITALQSEEMIMFLNDFTKQGFQRLGESLLNAKKNHSKKSIKNLSSQASLSNVDKKANTNYDSNIESEGTPLFNFKNEIKEFEMVNKLLLVEFAMEYHNMKEAVEKKWIEIIRKVETHSKN
jgi:hypothetical protein